MPTPDQLSQAVGTVIAVHRVSMKLTQDEFADRAGLHRTYISDVERGTRNISLKTLQRLAKALNVNTFDLLMEAETWGRNGHQSGEGTDIDHKVEEVDTEANCPVAQMQ
jgi:transcriptional regulator with XRE-family HTH domain